MPEFAHKTTPTLIRLHMWTKSNPGQGPPLKSPSPQLLSDDTTFQLGDFYVSVFTFRHTLFKESPVMPTTFLLHERKFQQCRDQETLKHIPALSRTKHPLISDEEKDIVNAITGKFSEVTRLRCWNHLIHDITRWLQAHGAPSQDVLKYTSDL